ncbi:hypothetical protein [Secundilactobacillus mixtipabuli]|uniref:Procyclic acidic repetitive protein (PARP) n=1 Tax=Secundilactobacillus mixtipabuli TaxID=1435342 RepID=A0A1Z5ID77_9LACO|nr:hypothetical protein [Secundilactobacillus mixtipabuli]GAW99763.1 Procyclic acidic repetitive protein (PARP) [Secundilactobacillus mixtipabuli]
MKFSRLLLGISMVIGMGVTSVQAAASTPDPEFSSYVLTYDVTRKVRDAGSDWRNLPTESKTVSVTKSVKGVTGFSDSKLRTYDISSFYPDYTNTTMAGIRIAPIIIPKGVDTFKAGLMIRADTERPKLRYVLENPDATRSSKQFTEYVYSTGTVDGLCQPVLSDVLKTDYSLGENKAVVIKRNMAPIQTMIHRNQINYQISYETEEGQTLSNQGLDTNLTVSYDQATNELAQLSDRVTETGYQIRSRQVTYDENGQGTVHFKVEKKTVDKPNPEPKPEPQPEPQPQPEPEVKPEPKPEPQPEPQPEPEAKPEPQPEPEVKPQPQPYPQPAPQPNPGVGSNPIHIEDTQSQELENLVRKLKDLMNRYAKLLEQQSLQVKKESNKHHKAKQKHSKPKKHHKQAKKNSKTKKHHKQTKKNSKVKQRHYRHQHQITKHHLHHKARR